MKEVILKNGPRDGSKVKVQDELYDEKKDIEVGADKYKPPTKTTTMVYSHYDDAAPSEKHYIPKKVEN